MDGRAGFIIKCNNCGARFVLTDENIDRRGWKNHKEEFIQKKKGDVFVDFGNAGGYGGLEIECLRCNQYISGSE
jgi:hypothetical protein